MSSEGIRERSGSPPAELDQTETAQLQFTVLYGAHSSAAAHCYLLEISGVKILLDCGWDSRFDVSLLEPLERIADEVSLVLISHANIEHLGALPYAYKHFKLNAPCYLTSPVLKLGQLALYDAVLNGSAPFTLDEIDAAVARWTELKYKQPGTLTLKNQESIIITPHPAGRTLGGAVWSVKQEPGLSVLYVSDIFHRKERFVEPLDFTPLPKNPTLLIQDGAALSKIMQLPLQRLDQRDAELVQGVLETLRRGGDVLIPVDTTSRALEVLLVLDEEWVKSQLQKTYELIFLTRVSSVVDVASSHVEWTSRAMQELMDTSARPGAMPPLRFASVAIVDSFEDAFATLNPAVRIRPPRVIVCGGVDMERSSFSREVFAREICHRAHSSIIIPCESFVPNSLTSQLITHAMNARTQPRHQQQRGPKIVQMEDERWVDLEGEELAQWQERKRSLEEERQRERETEVEILEYERATAEEDRAAAQHASDPLLPHPSTVGVQRSSSAPMIDRQLSVQQMDQQLVEVKRQMSSGGKDGEADLLTFTFVPPADSETTWDEYGALYDVDELMGEEEAKKGAALIEGKGSKQQKGRSRFEADAGETNPQDEQAQSNLLRREEEKMEEMGPRKKVQVMIEKQVYCDIRVVDFDGRMSPKDLFECVDQLKPRKLVVVRTTLRNSEKFAFDCQNKPACGVGLAPAPGECLDVAADSSVVRVRVPDETLQACPPPVTVSNQFVVQRLRGKIALLSMKDANESSDKRRRVVVAGGELASIVSVKDDEAMPGDSTDCWWISKKQEPNWSTVMDRLTHANIESEMKIVDDKAVLMCGGEDVIIWKPADGRFLVGGPLCDTYFKVRRILYNCFALV